MFRPDKLGLIGFVIIFALSFIFQGHDKNANSHTDKDGDKVGDHFVRSQHQTPECFGDLINVCFIYEIFM